MSDQITIFMCGDVMTGRGIDQILPHPGNPAICESYMQSAEGYVQLAEWRTGQIKRPVDFKYVWGDAIEALERLSPDVRIINLETAITTSDDYCRGKEVCYRMNPANVPCLTAAKIDICSLANNHVLDWGHEGLIETMDTLEDAGIMRAGAGRNLQDADAPAIIEIAGKGRVLFFSLGSVTSGIPPEWAATATTPGVNLLESLSVSAARRLGRNVKSMKRTGDVAVASIHWGGNWGYGIPYDQIRFAHELIDEGAIDIVYGHSSHHVKGMEIYKHKPIIYGCGDFINDYEGISSHESFRSDLGLMYFATFAPSTGEFVSLQMAPTRILHFRVNRSSKEEARWLRDVLNREGMSLGSRAILNANNTLTLNWD